MIKSFWNNCVSTFRRPAAKRRSLTACQWEQASEHLETRNMLSAACLVDPATAEVTGARARLQVPQVAGQWTVTVVGGGSATATVTQDKSKVTVALNFPNVAPVQLDGHFTRQNTHSIDGTLRLTVPEVGRVKVAYSFEFAEGSNPTTFTGEATLTAKTLPEPREYMLTGEKLVQQTLSPNGISKAAMFPTIPAFWDIDVMDGEAGLVGDLTIQQSGKGGKHITGTADMDGVQVTFKGNLKPNSTQLKGSAQYTELEGPSGKGKFDIVFFEQFTTFTGTATFKKINKNLELDAATVEI